MISAASQIRMENRSAAVNNAWHRHRRSAVDNRWKPFGAMLQITRVSWWLTKHLYLARHWKNCKKKNASKQKALLLKQGGGVKWRIGQVCRKGEMYVYVKLFLIVFGQSNSQCNLITTPKKKQQELRDMLKSISIHLQKLVKNHFNPYNIWPECKS